jgi:hypothetical protein
MALQAVSTDPKRVVISDISGFNMATSFMNRVNVTPVVSHTSSNTGAFAVGRFIVGGSEAVEKRHVDEDDKEDADL